jgi:uncharacterized ParB-like nuclease family protein
VSREAEVPNLNGRATAEVTAPRTTSPAPCATTAAAVVVAHEEAVGGLEVSVDQPPLMHIRHTTRQLQAHTERHRQRQTADKGTQATRPE